MKPEKPVGKLSIVGAINREAETSEHAAWALVRAVDEAGHIWEFPARSFSFDMTFVEPTP